jgi:hypothetical protein
MLTLVILLNLSNREFRYQCDDYDDDDDDDDDDNDVTLKVMM